jgi:hypothetical protein
MRQFFATGRQISRFHTHKNTAQRACAQLGISPGFA